MSTARELELGTPRCCDVDEERAREEEEEEDGEEEE